MANIHRNKFARGWRGIFGEGIVVHQTESGKTILAGMPAFDDNLAYNELQWMHHAAIRDAALYASVAEHQESNIRKADLLGTTAYALAVADWYGVPRVQQIDMDRWHGNPDETIGVKARDNVMVASVVIVIRDLEGQIQEMGEARQSKAGSAWWHYTTQSLVLITPFPIVQAVAFDLAGNRGSLTID